MNSCDAKLEFEQDILTILKKHGYVTGEVRIQHALIELDSKELPLVIVELYKTGG